MNKEKVLSRKEANQFQSEMMLNLGNCRDCDKSIMMSQKEKDWWDEAISANENMALPVRCKDCRRKRKESKSNIQVNGTSNKEIKAKLETVLYQLWDFDKGKIIPQTEESMGSLISSLDDAIQKL